MMAMTSRRYHVGPVHETVRSARDSRCDELLYERAAAASASHQLQENQRSGRPQTPSVFWREKGVTRGLLLPRLITHIAQERPKDRGGRARQDEEQQDELDVRVASEALRGIAPKDANLHERNHH